MKAFRLQVISASYNTSQLWARTEDGSINWNVTYASQKAVDQLWRIRNQVFEMFVDRVDGENSVFPNV
jgi:hypothetical protein